MHNMHFWVWSRNYNKLQTHNSQMLLYPLSSTPSSGFQAPRESTWLKKKHMCFLFQKHDFQKKHDFQRILKCFLVWCSKKHDSKTHKNKKTDKLYGFHLSSAARATKESFGAFTFANMIFTKIWSVLFRFFRETQILSRRRDPPSPTHLHLQLNNWNFGINRL